MTKAALARVIGANKVRRRPFKAVAAASAAGRNQAAPPAGQNSRAVKAKQDSTARVLPCVNCAWAQSVVGYSLLQGGADG